MTNYSELGITYTVEFCFISDKLVEVDLYALNLTNSTAAELLNRLKSLYGLPVVTSDADTVAWIDGDTEVDFAKDKCDGRSCVGISYSSQRLTAQRPNPGQSDSSAAHLSDLDIACARGLMPSHKNLFALDPADMCVISGARTAESEEDLSRFYLAMISPIHIVRIAPP